MTLVFTSTTHTYQPITFYDKIIIHVIKHLLHSRAFEESPDSNYRHPNMQLAIMTLVSRSVQMLDVNHRCLHAGSTTPKGRSLRRMSRPTRNAKPPSRNSFREVSGCSMSTTVASTPAHSPNGRSLRRISRPTRNASPPSRHSFREVSRCSMSSAVASTPAHPPNGRPLRSMPRSTIVHDRSSMNAHR